MIPKYKIQIYEKFTNFVHLHQENMMSEEVAHDLILRHLSQRVLLVLEHYNN